MGLCLINAIGGAVAMPYGGWPSVAGWCIGVVLADVVSSKPND